MRQHAVEVNVFRNPGEADEVQSSESAEKHEPADTPS